jgi:hypothetical protein
MIKILEFGTHTYAILKYFISSRGCSPAYFVFLISGTFLMTILILLLFIVIIMTFLASAPNGISAEDTTRRIRRAMAPLFVVPHMTNRHIADIEGLGSFSNILREVAELISIILTYLKQVRYLKIRLFALVTYLLA